MPRRVTWGGVAGLPARHGFRRPSGTVLGHRASRGDGQECLTFLHIRCAMRPVFWRTKHTGIQRKDARALRRKERKLTPLSAARDEDHETTCAGRLYVHSCLYPGDFASLRLCVEFRKLCGKDGQESASYGGASQQSGRCRVEATSTPSTPASSRTRRSSAFRTPPPVTISISGPCVARRR